VTRVARRHGRHPHPNEWPPDAMPGVTNATTPGQASARRQPNLASIRGSGKREVPLYVVCVPPPKLPARYRFVSFYEVLYKQPGAELPYTQAEVPTVYSDVQYTL